MESSASPKQNHARRQCALDIHAIGDGSSGVCNRDGIAKSIADDNRWRNASRRDPKIRLRRAHCDNNIGGNRTFAGALHGHCIRKIAAGCGLKLQRKTSERTVRKKIDGKNNLTTIRRDLARREIVRGAHNVGARRKLADHLDG